MAFCPNCGTPNTEQAAKCVNCGNGLTPPPAGGGGGKFKGTIMMGAVSPAGPAPGQPAAPAQEAPAQPAAAQPAAAQPAADSKNLAYQKTMVGGIAAPVPPPQQAAAAQPTPAQPAASQPAAPAVDHSDLATAATVEQASPLAGGGFSAPAEPRAPQAGFSARDEQPTLPQNNATKMMMVVLGAAVVIAALIVGAALMMRSSESEAEPADTTSSLPHGEAAFTRLS